MSKKFPRFRLTEEGARASGIFEGHRRKSIGNVVGRHSDCRYVVVAFDKTKRLYAEHIDFIEFLNPKYDLRHLPKFGCVESATNYYDGNPLWKKRPAPSKGFAPKIWTRFANAEHRLMGEAKVLNSKDK